MRMLSVGRIKFLLVLTASCLLTACMAIDSVDQRADDMGEGINRFRNTVILRNIVRSANDEPLNFVAIPNVVGHNTIKMGIPGSPSFNWGLHGILQSKILGGTSNEYNTTNDFTLAALDDPATYAALNVPLDAATIASFVQGQGYASDLLYLIFIHRIRVADEDGKIFAEFFPGHPNDEVALKAIAHLASLELIFNMEKGSVAGQTRRPRAQICFNEHRQQGIYGWEALAAGADGKKASRKGQIVRPLSSASSDEEDARRGRRGGERREQKYNKASYCHERGTWLPSSSKDGGGDTTNIACISIAPAGKGKPEARALDCGLKREKKSPDSAAYYVIYDASSKKWIEITPRSTWGIYQFLGTLAANIIHKGQLPVKLDRKNALDDLTVLNIRKNYEGACFAEVADKNGKYCIPDEPQSRYTKIIFSILKHLIGLQSAIVNVPANSSSVRITP